MNKVAININSVSITYLQPGHTYMPVDSVHSAIDSNLKKKIVWAPSEWPTIIVNSRNKPKPYEVFVLNYTDFKDFKKLQSDNFPKLTTTDDGQKIKMSEVKKVTFPKKSSTVLLNFCYEPGSEEKTVTIAQTKERRRSKDKQLPKNSEPQPAFKKILPISVAKYTDLLKLCESGVIPNRYHREYISLKRNEIVEDTLQETDEEDCNTETEPDQN